MPLFDTLYAKLIAAGVLLVLLVSGYAYWHHTVIEKGVEIGADKVQKRDDKALAHNAEVYVATDKQIAPIEVVAATASSAAQTHTVVVIKTVEKIVHENPVFSAVHRPTELDRLRAEQIARLRALAGPGATPAESGTAAE